MNWGRKLPKLGRSLRPGLFSLDSQFTSGDGRIWRWIDSVSRDLRYGVRTLAKKPGFTATASLTLALGIGATTTIFSVINTILLRSLPFEDPGRIVVIHERNPEKSWRRSLHLPTFVKWREENQSIESMAMATGGGENNTISGVDGAERMLLQHVSRGIFSVLGVPPRLGRTFSADEVSYDRSSSVVISHGLWQRHFGGDPGVLGQTLTINGEGLSVVGVMPPGFWITPWAREIDVWRGLNLEHNALTLDARWPLSFGRLRPGVTLEEARAEFAVFGQRLAQADPKDYAGWQVGIEPLQDFYFEGWSDTLYMLLGAVGLVLLIACANVANLLLARASTRQHEFALRSSLGASRTRLIRQSLTESLLLSVLGGALGVLLTFVGIRLFVALTPAWFPRVSEIRIDGLVLLFTTSVCLVTGILFGLAPALKTSKGGPNEVLKEGGQRTTMGSQRGGRRLLVVSEVALAMVLLVGAGLMMNTLLRVQNLDLGYNPEKLLTARMELGGAKYWKQVEHDRKRVTTQVASFTERLLERLRSLPAVQSAAVAGQSGGLLVQIIGGTDQQGGSPPSAIGTEVTSDYFTTMQIPLLKGRVISAQDTESSPWVAVIDDAMVRQYFPDEDPIGKLVHMSYRGSSGMQPVKSDKPRQIVGVVGGVRRWNLQQEPSPAIYFSHRQHIWDYPGGNFRMHVGKQILLRTAGEPSRLASSLRPILMDVDKDQVLFGVMTMEEQLADALSFQRFNMRLYGLFAGLALLLAAVGLYGVISYSVAERTQEFGVRMALGAEPAHILRSVLRDGLMLSLIGVAVGTLVSIGLTRLIESQLYGVTATDPFTFGVVAVMLIGVALLACYVPARRAKGIDPLHALRYE